MPASTNPKLMPSFGALSSVNLDSATVWGALRTNGEILKTHLGKLLRTPPEELTRRDVHAVRDAYDLLNQNRRDYRGQLPKDISRLLTIAQEALNADVVTALDKLPSGFPEESKHGPRIVTPLKAPAATGWAGAEHAVTGRGGW